MTDPTVEDIMTHKVKTLGPDDTLGLAEDVMEMDRIRHLPVVSRGQVVGIVSQRDLFRASLGVALGFSDKERNQLLRRIRVQDAMSTPPLTVSPGTSLRDAARLMLDRKVGCLPVVDRDLLKGLITETDLLRQAWVDDELGGRRVRVQAHFTDRR